MGSDHARLHYKRLNSFESDLEQLQYAIDCVVYDATLVNPAQAIEELVALAMSRGQWLRSMVKVLVNKNTEVIVRDFSAVDGGKNIEFFVRGGSVVEGGVVGYLPNVRELRNGIGRVEDLYYEVESGGCLRVNRFDGVVSVGRLGCDRWGFPVRVVVRSMGGGEVEFASVRVVDVDVEVEVSGDRVEFYEVNGGAVNVVYESFGLGEFCWFGYLIFLFCWVLREFRVLFCCCVI